MGFGRSPLTAKTSRVDTLTRPFFTPKPVRQHHNPIGGKTRRA